MDAKVLIGVFGILVATASCETTVEPPKTSTAEETSFVPGVFISAETLKSIQEKAKHPESIKDIKPEALNVSKKSELISDIITFPDELSQNDQAQQRLNQQMSGIRNQQNYSPNNPNQHPMNGNQPMANQPPVMPGSPQANTPNQQPGYQQQGYQQPGYQPNGLQQPAYQPPAYQQPGYQQLGYQQPGYQPNYQQSSYQQPGYQQPGYQQPGYQPVMYQQPGYQQNTMGQPTILLTQQPGYISPMPANQPLYQQPMQAQQYFIPNGQMTNANLPVNANYVSQPNLNMNSRSSMGQSPGTVYAMVPVNTQNAEPNPNLNTNNGYFVPVQQMPSNGVMMNNGKK